MRQPGLLGQARRSQGRLDHGLDHHLAGVARLGGGGVGVHHLGQQLLVERAPVDADADRLRVGDGDLDDRGELLVAALGADVARVDAVLGQRRRRVRVLRQQEVAVVVKVADERHGHAERVELGADDRHRLGGGVVVDRDPHQLGAGVRQLRDLDRGRIGIGGVGVRHRLHHDRVRPIRPERPPTSTVAVVRRNMVAIGVMVERGTCVGTRRAFALQHGGGARGDRRRVAATRLGRRG